MAGNLEGKKHDAIDNVTYPEYLAQPCSGWWLVTRETLEPEAESNLSMAQIA